jgi:TM2 domain-containing membrane protein YozV
MRPRDLDAGVHRLHRDGGAVTEGKKRRHAAVDAADVRRPEAKREPELEDDLDAENERAGDGDRFVTIRRVSSGLEADRLRVLLEDEGIVATTQGAGHSALTGGLMDPILELRLQVPERDAERALEILEALEEPEEPAVAPPGEDDELRGDGPFRSGAITEARSPRKPNVALAAALIVPMFIGVFGAGHFYARRPGRGIALLATAWLAIVAAFASGHIELCLVAPLVAIVDGFAAASAIRAETREREAIRRTPKVKRARRARA